MKEMDKPHVYEVPKKELPRGLKSKTIYGPRAPEKPENTMTFRVRQNVMLNGRKWDE
jgi:hypothetical protein